MAVNASFHQLQVLIGEDNQDWSQAVVSFETSDQERDDSGLIVTRGKLVLAWIKEAPDSMNPRSNAGRARWFKGQRVIVNVTNSAGNFVRHPRGWLYITKPPLPPTPDKPELELELADVLQFRTYPQPKGQVTAPGLSVQVATPPTQQVLPGAPSIWETVTGVAATLRNQAIAVALNRTNSDPRYVTSAGIPNEYVGNVDKYAVASPLYHTGEDGYVQFAGKIAYGGIKAIYQRNDGKIDAVSLDLKPPNSPIATVELGHPTNGEMLWECTEGGETPVESVIMQGNLKGLKSADSGSSDPDDSLSKSIADEYGPLSAIDPDSSSTAQVLFRQISKIDGASKYYKYTRTQSQAALSLLNPTVYPKNTSRGFESDSVIEQIYEPTSGRLIKTWEVERRPFLTACATVFSRMSENDQAFYKSLIVKAKETETYYFYDNNTGVLTRQEKTTREPVGAIVTDEDLAVPQDYTVSEKETKSWREVRKGEWEETTALYQSLVRVQPNIDLGPAFDSPEKRVEAKLALFPKSRTIESSNSGQNNPPASEKGPLTLEGYDIPIQGVAKFTAPKGPFNERERPYTLDIGCTGLDQLQELAQIKGAELFGKAQGARIQLPLRDEFLNNPQPLKFIAVIEPELLPTQWRKNLVLYQLDALQFTHGEGQAVVTATLIWIGTQEGGLVNYA